MLYSGKLFYAMRNVADIIFDTRLKEIHIG